MASAIELTLDVLGISGLFTSCIERFDIVIYTTQLDRNFELLCTQLELERTRLIIWGQSLGLVPGPDGRQLLFNKSLDENHVRPGINSSLDQLRIFLEEADVVSGRYAVRDERDADNESTSSHLAMFGKSFENVKKHIENNQSQDSSWLVTRWYIRDETQFECLVSKIRELLNALYNITNDMEEHENPHDGLKERQNAMLIDEIDSVSDTRNLALLHDVGSSEFAPGVLRAVSDTANVRFLAISSSSRSYDTVQKLEKQPSSEMTKPLSALVTLPTTDSATTSEKPEDPVRLMSSEQSENSILPQHQRWMAEILSKSCLPSQKYVFTDVDSQYGKTLHSIKKHDDQISAATMGQLLVSSESSEYANSARRMFLELRNIRRAALPFITAAPLGDSLDKILASIEGPPGTPYEGGIFWITALLVPRKPPLLQFHTRIYHPNIDDTGKLCVDYTSWLHDSSLVDKKPGAQWIQSQLSSLSEHVTNHYNLGSLLVAVCGLLASPNIEDPLVPEIAEKYTTDYKGYCAAATAYTKRYASSTRPEQDTLLFADSEIGDATEALEPRENQRKPMPEIVFNYRTSVNSILGLKAFGRSKETQIPLVMYPHVREGARFLLTRGECKCLLEQLALQTDLNRDLLQHLQLLLDSSQHTLVTLRDIADWCYAFDLIGTSESVDTEEWDSEKAWRSRSESTKLWVEMFLGLKRFLYHYVVEDNYRSSRTR